MADGTIIQLNPVIGSTDNPNSTNHRSWLDFTHPDYDANNGRWIFTHHHYTGDIVDPVIVKDYLRKRSLGESPLAYKERCDLADYTNHFAAIVDSIAGMLFAVESDANRITNKVTTNNGKTSIQTVLGDFIDPKTVMGRLALDADGDGNGYMSVWKSLATELLSLHEAWVLVDAADGQNPRIRIFPITSVPNWLYDNQGLASVLIKEKIDGRTSLQDEVKNKQKNSYLVFTRTGWTRYEKDSNGKEEIKGFGTHRFEDRNGRLALPVFKVHLPLRRMVGWQLAVKANRIFNMESSRDHLLRLANAPKLNIVAGDTLFDKITLALEQGSNALQNSPDASRNHEFIAPSSEPASILSDVIVRKVEELWVSAFRMYGDSAKEKTATEAKQDVSQGVGAFLHLLKASIDGAENQAMWRLEQIQYPRQRNFWFISSVERSDDFLPANVDAAIEKIRDRYFGKSGLVPVGRSTLISAIRTMLSWDGLQMAEHEIEAAVDAHILARGFEDLQGTDLPAEAIIQHMLKIFMSTGLITEMPSEDKQETMIVKLKKEIQKGADARSEAPANKVAYQGVSTDGRKSPKE